MALTHEMGGSMPYKNYIRSLGKIHTRVGLESSFDSRVWDSGPDKKSWIRLSPFLHFKTFLIKIVQFPETLSAHRSIANPPS